MSNGPDQAAADAYTAVAPRPQIAAFDLEYLLRHSRSIISVLAEDGTWIYSSPAGTEQLGYLPGYNPEGGLFALLHPDDQGLAVEAFAQLVAGVTPEPLVTRVATITGEYRWFETTAEDARDDPAVHGFILNSTDITDRRTIQEELRESDQHHKSLLEHAAEFTFVWTAEGELTYVSPAAVKFTNGHWSPGIMLFENDFIHPEDFDEVVRTYGEMIAGGLGTTVHIEARLQPYPGADWFTMSFTMTNRIDDPAVAGVVVNSRDESSKVLARQELAESERRFRKLVHHGSEFTLVWGIDGLLSYVSPSVVRITNGMFVEGAEVAQEDMVHPEDFTGVEQTVTDLMVRDPGTSMTITLRLRITEGMREFRWFEATFTNLLDDPDVAGLVVNAHDVTDRFEYQQRLAHQATHDELTGLPNRAALLEGLADMSDAQAFHGFSPSANRPDTAAVLFCDLDRFKMVNDSQGHEVGDELLREVAHRLTDGSRRNDLVARLGGDEFVVVCPNTAEQDAIALASRLRAELAEPYKLSSGTFVVSASIGVAITDGTMSPSDVVRDADVAMYQSKTHGRDQVTVFDPALRRAAVARVVAENRLRAALIAGELEVYYQPQYSLVDRKLTGVEALVRWEDPDVGVISPDAFLPLAEETGLIGDIDRFVFERALAATARWHRAGHPLDISVNCSGRRLHDRNTPAEVDRVLTMFKVDPASLTIELTENILIQDAKTAHVNLSALREMGVKLAIDDFGTGFSALSHLKEFPVTTVKLDRSFVANVATSIGDQAIVDAVLGMAHALDMTVVGEGIEDEAQLEYLLERGCQIGQGYLFAKPMTRSDIDTLLGVKTGSNATSTASVSPAFPAS